MTDGLSPGLSLKAQELRELCLRAGEDGYLSSSKESKFTFLQPFCSVWALSGLDAALFCYSTTYPNGSALTEMPKNNALPAPRSYLSPVKLTCEINHHTHQT